MKNAIRLYAVLLKLYPRGFRKAFGAEMRQTFTDHYSDIKNTKGHVGMDFWLATVTDEISNSIRQHMEPLMHEESFLTISAAKWVVAATLFIPLFALFYAAFVRVSLILPHPPVSGIGVLFAFAALVLLPLAFSVLTGYILACTLVRVLPRRTVTAG